jgi:nucleotide-binding universal stress UspA family protein
MKILVAYDGSSFADIALDDLQRAGLPQVAQAWIVSAVEPDRHTADESCAETAANRLQTYFPRWDVRLETSTGHAAAAILDRAHSWPADLIVVGTHGRSGLARVVLGSVSFKVIREANCSVRVGRLTEQRPGQPLRVLIGDDGSPEAEAAVDTVCSREWPRNTELRVLGVPQTLAPADARSYREASHSLLATETFLKTDAEERNKCDLVIDRAVKRLQDAGLKTSTVVEEGSPAQVLLHYSKNWPADAIFVGACGMGRLERLLLGSVAESLVTHAACTVEVVRKR